MTTRGYMAFGVLMLGLVCATLTVACKSTGAGRGESRTGDVKVSFQWEQSEPTAGMLKAIVIQPGGAPETYAGKFYQITSDSHIETISDLWDPWYPRWGGWAYWGPEPQDSFIEH